MTTDAAVIDAPPATETQAEIPADPKGLQATDQPDASVQTDSPDSAPTTDADDKPASADHAAELESERVQAEEARLAELAETRAQELIKQREQEARQKERKDNKTSARTATMGVVTNLANRLAQMEIRDADGESYNFNPKLLTSAVESMALKIEPEIRAEVEESYRTSFDIGLGDASEGFWEEADKLAEEDGSTPVAALLDLYVEKQASKAKSITSLDLDDLVKLSPKARLSLANAKKAEFERGRENPLPAGEPRGNGQSASPRVTYSTKQEARALHIANKITDGEMRAIRNDPSIPEQ